MAKLKARRRVQPGKTRTQTAIRYRKARKDASVGTIQARIEKKFGLPVGSVRIVSPSGRKVREDATIKGLKRVWND